MPMKIFIKLILLFSVISCISEKENLTSDKYLRWVDDIPFDATLDDKDFIICRGEERAMQYFNNSKGLEYEGEKAAIIKAFEESYDFSTVANENGLIRIRFLVNCEGKTGRFRLISMDEKYNKKQLDMSITNQLLEITKNLKGWKPKVYGSETSDYYQYLIFKINQGKIIEILP